jgi:hypothetical protein
MARVLLLRFVRLGRGLSVSAAFFFLASISSASRARSIIDAGSPSRYRKSGFRTKAQALAAETRAQEDAMFDRKRITLADAYEQYMAASRNMKPLGRDHWHRRWPLAERDRLLEGMFEMQPR